MGDGTCTIGFSTFDISAPEALIGPPFDIGIPAVIAALQNAQRGLVVIGEVFGYVEDQARGGDKYNVSFGVYDGNSSIEVRKYGLTAEEAKELSGQIKNGTAIAMQGYIKHETRRNTVDIDFTFF